MIIEAGIKVIMNNSLRVNIACFMVKNDNGG